MKLIDLIQSLLMGSLSVMLAVLHFKYVYNVWPLPLFCSGLSSIPLMTSENVDYCVSFHWVSCNNKLKLFYWWDLLFFIILEMILGRIYLIFVLLLLSVYRIRWKHQVKTYLSTWFWAASTASIVHRKQCRLYQ